LRGAAGRGRLRRLRIPIRAKLANRLRRVISCDPVPAIGSRSRDAFASELCHTLSEAPQKRGMERREAPKIVATPRGRMLPLARASGVARATERSACANRLLRARGASRRSTAALAPSVGRHR
jgi:hypothetical protein